VPIPTPPSNRRFWRLFVPILGRRRPEKQVIRAGFAVFGAIRSRLWRRGGTRGSPSIPQWARDGTILGRFGYAQPCRRRLPFAPFGPLLSAARPQGLGPGLIELCR